MQELRGEHKYARNVVRHLYLANSHYSDGNVDSIPSIMQAMEELCLFYPRHIKKEDQQFFLPAMKYFSPMEQEKMLADFWEFDQTLIHEKYKMLVKELE